MENNNLPPPGGGNQPEPTPLKFYEFRSRTNSINDNIIHNILEKHIPTTIATSICFTTTTTTSFASPIASSSLQSYTTSSVIHLNRPKMSTIQNPIPVFENNSKRKSSPPIKTMNNNNKAKKLLNRGYQLQSNKPHSIDLSYSRQMIQTVMKTTTSQIYLKMFQKQQNLLQYFYKTLSTLPNLPLV